MREIYVLETLRDKIVKYCDTGVWEKGGWTPPSPAQALDAVWCMVSVYSCYSFRLLVYSSYSFRLLVYYCYSFRLLVYYCYSFRPLVYSCYSFRLLVYYCYSF